MVRANIIKLTKSLKFVIRIAAISLFTWSKQKWLVWRAGFFPANQGFLKTFQIVLIEWIKAGPPKIQFCFNHVNSLLAGLHDHNKNGFFGGPAFFHPIRAFWILFNSLFTWSKQKWLFWRASFFPVNQGFLKTFQIALIGWIKAGPPKKLLLFWSCKQAIYMLQLPKASKTSSKHCCFLFSLIFSKALRIGFISLNW